MSLHAVTIRDFRNLASLDITLPEQGVVVLGPNGQGKTNLLEALYYLVLFRSLRGAKDRELVRFGADGFFVGGSNGKHVTAGYEVRGRRKKVTIDGVEQRRLGEAVGAVTAVVFAPADRTIVTEGPAARRRYLDIVLALSSPPYLTSLSSMRGALKQRNAALRRAKAQEAMAFDEPFARAASQVADARRRWVAQWAQRYGELSHDLGEAGTPRIAYRAHLGREEDDAEHLERALASTIDRDLQRGMTTVGPHRDDLTLSLDGHDLRRYGSAGQHRTAAIALKLLEAATLTDARGTAPIGLYDDVFAELDADRQARLLALIQDTLPGQAIIVAPRESEVPAGLLDRPRWGMQHGALAT